MNSWAELGVGELDDFGYGVSTGWVSIEDGRTFIRQFETPHFVVNMTAAVGEVNPKWGTRIRFDVDEVLPDMLAAQDLVKSLGYPSRKGDPATYKVWSRALTAQGRRFKQIIAEVKAESPELAALFTDWGGCSFAHGSSRPDPVIRGLPMIRTIATLDGAVLAAWIGAVFVSKRDSYTEELAQRRISGAI